LPPDIYDPSFLQALFDEMSRSYGVVNYWTSFGFCERWRRACARLIDIPRGSVVYDLMTGMGEVCHSLAPVVGHAGRIVAVDISPNMCTEARKRTAALVCAIDVRQLDALDSALPTASADAVVACFGLKTFNRDQLSKLAAEVRRMLKPGGVYSFLEISVPRNWLLRMPFLFYIGRLVPLIGRLALGNPDNYRMLGVYTKRFNDCRAAAEAFELAGLAVQQSSVFFGCATAISGHRPSADDTVERQ
jgi:demethylmenaquinone methyltransferase/2-methoxy-6-polyprenyl-1,4-benzoquinol methylase